MLNIDAAVLVINYWATKRMGVNEKQKQSTQLFLFFSNKNVAHLIEHLYPFFMCVSDGSFG